MYSKNKKIIVRGTLLTFETSSKLLFELTKCNGNDLILDHVD